MMNDLSKVEDILCYDFTNIQLLELALTHSSFSHENGGGNYEYLEFVGDSILGMIVSEYLFREVSESIGMLSKLKASLVSTDNLVKIVKDIGLDSFIRVGKSLKGSVPIKMYADVFEAVVAAIYFDAGIEVTRAFVLDFVIKDRDNVNKHLLSCTDYKTMLQEYVQSTTDKDIVYETKLVGSDFQSKLYYKGKLLSEGKGRSKKLSEQMCARLALNILKNEQ